MFAVEVEKICGCFTRFKMSSSFQFDSKEKANQKTKELLKIMNEEFCGKHKFKSIDEGTIIRIVEDEENE
jgi:hypothetical protein